MQILFYKLFQLPSAISAISNVMHEVKLGLSDAFYMDTVIDGKLQPRKYIALIKSELPQTIPWNQTSDVY